MYSLQEKTFFLSNQKTFKVAEEKNKMLKKDEKENNKNEEHFDVLQLFVFFLSFFFALIISY